MQPVEIFRFVSSSFYSLTAIAYVFQWEGDIFATRWIWRQQIFVFMEWNICLQAEQELEWQMICWQSDLSFSNVKLRPQLLPGHLMGPARESLVLPFKQSLIAQQMLVHTHTWDHTLVDIGPHAELILRPHIFIDSVSRRYFTQGQVEG